MADDTRNFPVFLDGIDGELEVRFRCAVFDTADAADALRMRFAVA